MAGNGHGNGLACRCLNVRIAPSTPPQPPAQSPDPGYTTIFVGQEGISVAHHQLTLRSRSKTIEEKQGEDTVLTRYTSLTCLACYTLVYRVHQVTTPDLDSEEGPVQPTEDWTENELLGTSSGWIEVFKECITGEVISQAEASPLFSSLFRILLPSEEYNSTTVIPDYSTYKPATPDSPTPDASPRQHLPPLPPLFLPPPFTPSHGIFQHISSVVTVESLRLRRAAEQTIRRVIQEQVLELEAVETKLRKDVEQIWVKSRDSIDKIEAEAAQRGRVAWAKRRHSNTARTSPTRPGPGPGPNGTPASIRVTDFVPIANPMVRMASPLPPSIPSALSTSLATSSFHYPAAAERNTTSSGQQRERNGSGSPPPYSSNPPPPSVVKRFRYVSEMQAQMEAIQKRQEIAAQAEESIAQQPNAAAEPSARGRSPRTSKSAIKKPKVKVDSKSPTKSKRSSSRTEDAKEDTTPSKGKRKVTFDVKPEVAIIDGDNTVPSKPKARTQSNADEPETIFDFENENGERREDVASPLSPHESVTPAEPIQAPIRPNRTRIVNTAGLPSSFSGLRPASLPVPSLLRARHTAREPLDERPRSVIVRESLLGAASDDPPKRHDVEEYRVERQEEEEEVDLREAEILRLVAASTPSHRSAWKRNSKAWQLFVGRQEKKAKDVDKDAIVEEEEDSTAESTSSRAGYFDESDDEASTGEEEQKDSVDSFPQIAASLPIPIAPLKQNMARYNATALQPKTSLTDRPGVLVPPLRKESSDAARRASYAERDRSRLIDPGALDFAADDEVEEEEEYDPDVASVGGKGRQRALKILKARNEIPAAGMWRSLA
ncbi:hypothetical protein NLI96_g2599 [Meripilus lineatus]|uniref:Uncharacterized protein n=1 Tax=Meripilus lineatus TaxID=2056292 RepID=A0AAD5YHD3_9APHY|nr:hypothetical protein NLI96_g2599 [Physisporinus lineatus]